MCPTYLEKDSDSTDLYLPSCMKEGKLFEHGTHAELMERQGEYFKMYNIQARAFDHGVGNEAWERK